MQGPSASSTFSSGIICSSHSRLGHVAASGDEALGQSELGLIVVFGTRHLRFQWCPTAMEVGILVQEPRCTAKRPAKERSCCEETPMSGKISHSCQQFQLEVVYMNQAITQYSLYPPRSLEGMGAGLRNRLW